MNTLTNKEFIIASKSRKIIFDLSNMVEIVPKKYYFQKNKLLSYAYDLLENIYLMNETIENIDDMYNKLLMDISMIDFSLSFFLSRKVVAKKHAERILYYLTEITKMTSVWHKNKKALHES